MNDDDFDYNPNELKSLRPDLRKKQFYCVKCRKEPHLWAHYGLHKGGREAGQIFSGEGIIHGYLECHGDREEIMITFSQAARYIESGEKIPVFDSVNHFKPEFLARPGGLLE